MMLQELIDISEIKKLNTNEGLDSYFIISSETGPCRSFK